MDLGIHGKLALVTGSTAGIGCAIADALLAEGARVVVNGRDARKVDDAATWLGERHGAASHTVALAGNLASGPVDAPRIAGVVGDLSDPDEAAAVVRAVEELGPPDILVNNVGFFEVKPLDELTDTDWFAIFQLNVMSSVRMAKAFLPGMLGRGWGRIVFIASEQSMKPNPAMMHYAMTKAAQVSVARSLAELTKGTGVTVNSALVGPTWTEGVEVFLERVAARPTPRWTACAPPTSPKVTALPHSFSASPDRTRSRPRSPSCAPPGPPRSTVRPSVSTAASSGPFSEEAKVIYELRTYDFAPGTATRYLELFATRGLPLITRHLPLLGCWLAETGDLNRLHHLWAYSDLADRARRRTALWADQEWTQSFVPEAFSLVARQESRILGVAIGTSRLADVEAAAVGALPAVPATPLLATGWTVICFAVDPDRLRTTFSSPGSAC
jgi:NAD(P)-dependent dehydrogenase (short-subunit alcohol dehydrogenase family)